MSKLIEIVKIVVIYYISVFLSSMIPIPSGLIGMLILFLAISIKLVKINEIEKYVDFILKHLAFFFIPLAVTLTLDLHYISDVFIEVVSVIVISTFLVMGLTGYVVQKLEKGVK